MAGMTSEQVTLGVHNLSGRTTHFVKTGEPKDQYLTSVAWDPSEKYLFIGILNREQNHLKFNRYSAATGEWEKTIFEEKHAKWVEPENPPLFLKTKPNVFIWQSERDGFNHLYQYDTDGKLIRQLSSGNEPVTRILGTDPAEENLFYETAADLGLSRKVYLVNLKTGKSRLLTPEKGTHNAVLSSDGNFLIVQYSSLTTPRKIYSLEVKSGKTKNLSEAGNPLKDYAMPRAEFVTITAADGKTPLNGRIIRPADFDSGKKYPVIVYVYGGPHAQLITDSWLGGAGLWDYYMAQEGFILFTLDNRGSADRGFDFENVIHRQLGQEEIKDQMRGVEYLKSLPYVDETRIGVYGWSFGGFMTTTLTTTHPDVFKAAVAGGPVIDWKWYEVMYGERYMDTPQENPEGYALTSLTDKAKNLKARLLMIHGAQDPVVVMQHSLEFVNACIKAGKQVDYFVYPDHEHNVRGKDRLHLMEKIADYFLLHLK
jgi:dipeptidyl-peptidase-4